MRNQLQHKIDTKTKPLGSLGRLEEIALQAGMIQHTTQPQINHPHIVVFAGDHGIALTGLVNPYPQEVTAQMVMNFLHGGAAINVFTRQHQIRLTVADAGVNYDFGEAIYNPAFINAKINRGTSNYMSAPAMSEEEALLALTRGREIVSNIAAGGCNCIGFGEMGIGNTSSASLIMSAITGIPVEACIGRGTGTNPQQLEIKIQTLKSVFSFHQLHLLATQPLQLLSKVGGFEIAMMAGAYLQAAEEKMLIVVDGFITTAALLIAQQMKKDITDNCIFAHTSGEQGHEKMLAYLKANPLLNLGLRLGEGTGAALAIPFIQSAVKFMNEMASFESANVSTEKA